MLRSLSLRLAVPTFLIACAPADGIAPDAEETGSPVDTDTAAEELVNPVPWRIVINELQASNPALNVDPDDSEATPDWLELYNPETFAISLAGLFVSDDPDTPLKHPLPDVDIEPGGFLLLIADGDPDAGPTHVDFKLSSEGETVGVYTESGAPLDRIMFENLGDGQVAGRLPDGGPLSLLSPATPGETNTTAEVLEGP